MKKIMPLVLVLFMVLSLTGCGEQVPDNLKLPFEVDDIQSIEVCKNYNSSEQIRFEEYFYKKPTETNSSERLDIEDDDNIRFIYGHLDGIPIKKAKTEIPVPGSTAYEFVFLLSNSTKFTVTYHAEAVKQGLISINGENTYFTASDIGWIWSNIEKPTDTEN